MKAAELDEVSKFYGKQQVLDAVTFSVKAGQITGLVGPSGSGKSTIIGTLTGSVRPSAGSTTVLGRNPTAPPIRKRVGFMPQAAALYTDLTAQENLQFFGSLYGLRASHLREAIPEALATAALPDTGSKLARDFSGGMQRRLSLAIALLTTPDLLLLDEPTVGLDPKIRLRLWDVFAALARDGKSLLISTHVMDEAAACDRLIFIQGGRKIADGTPEELLRLSATKDLEQAYIRFEEGIDA